MTTTLVVAHFNHKLRGAESEADAGFVRSLSERLQLHLVERSLQYDFDERSSTSPQTDEAFLRRIRYRFLEKTAYEVGARYVAVGHHADDQVETVLHNLFRGSGLSGLRGMPPFRGLGQDLVLVRPMIEVWRDEVAEYLKNHQQAFRSDSSNASQIYTRNRIRNQLLPTIQEHYGRDVRSSIASAASLLGEVYDDVDLQSQRWTEKNHCNMSETSFRVSYTTESKTAWHVVQHAIVNEYHRRGWAVGNYTRRHWDSVRDFFHPSEVASNTTSMLPNNVIVRRMQDGFVFEKVH